MGAARVPLERVRLVVLQSEALASREQRQRAAWADSAQAPRLPAAC